MWDINSMGDIIFWYKLIAIYLKNTIQMNTNLDYLLLFGHFTQRCFAFSL
jgi:hypothetical protein